MKYLLFIIIVILSSSVIFAQEDVCDGEVTFTSKPGDTFELCWTRNHPNDQVVQYKIFDNDSPDISPGSFGKEIKVVNDSSCMKVHCFTGPMITPNEPGIHYMTVRAFDDHGFYSDASDYVILTITLLILPPHSLTVEVVK